MSRRNVAQMLFIFLILSIWTASAMALNLELTSVLEMENPVVKADQTLAEEVKKQIDSLDITVSWAGQLYGSEDGILNALISGDLAMGHVSARALSDQIPELRILDMPYLFESRAILWHTLDGEIGKKLIQDIEGEEEIDEALALFGVEAEPTGLVFLGWYDAGARAFAMTKEIDRPEDLAGKKIVTANSTGMQTFLSGISAQPAVLPRHTVYSALFQGSVDGTENDPVTLRYLGDCDGAPYLLLDEHLYDVEVLLMSSKVYDRLTDQERDVLRAAVDTVTSAERTYYEYVEQQTIKALEHSGVHVNRNGEAFAAWAKDNGTTLWNRIAPDLSEWISDIQTLKSE